jgi:hypothetical protein
MHQHKTASRFGERPEAADAARPVGKATLTEALGDGEGLPNGQRAQFEASLGRDLSHVRVHTGDGAARLTSSLGARAFAAGSNIAFAKGEYDPESRDGKHLLAHEVAHAAQQQGAAAGDELATTQPGDAVESNADVAASAMVAGERAEVAAAPMSIARRTVNEPRAPAPSGDAAGGSSRADGGASGAAGGAAPKEDEIGELTADRVGMEPDEGEGGPEVPPHDLAGGKQELAGVGQMLGGGGAEGAGAGEGSDSRSGGGGGGGWLSEGSDSRSGGGGGGGWLSEGSDSRSGGGGGGGWLSEGVAGSIAEAQADAREGAAQAEAEATAYKAQVAERRDRFDAEQQALTVEQLKTMSSTDKRATLADLGFDPKKVKQLKDSELDGLIQGKLEAEQLKTKIFGMTPEELGGLSSAHKLKFLTDLGIDREDLEKAGAAKTDKLFADITKAAHVPGVHKVKIQIKGGLFGKSWVVTVKCDADGGVAAEAQKEGGFLSKLVGWVKAALPLVLTVLAPITGGASLIALSVYQTVVSIKNGDWLGAITGAASALVGVGALKAVANGTGGLAQAFSKVASVAGKVKNVAQAAQAAMIAAKAKNAGSLLGALSAGAAAFAGFAGNAAGKFAQTMTRWSERLKKWSEVIGGGEKVLKGIESGDAIAAIGGALDTAAGFAAADGKTGKALQRASNITGFVNAGRHALQGNPPNYAAVAEAAMGMAAQLSEDRKVEDAARLVSSANRLKAAWDARASNPAGLAEAALGLAEAIQLAKYDLEHDDAKDGEGKPDADRAAIQTRYQRSTRVVQLAGSLLKAASARPHPNYTAALDAVTGLVAEFTEDKRIDSAAVLTSRLDAWTKAVNAGDQAGIVAASVALFQAVDGLRTTIEDERAKAKQEAEAKLGAGETLPDDGGALPHVPTPSSELPGAPGLATPLQGSGGGSAGNGAAGGAGPSTAPGTTGASPSGPGTTGTPAQPGQTAPAKPVELPSEVKAIIAIVKVAADVASGFEHPTAKKLIKEWEDMVEQAETLSKTGGDETAYQKALAGLRLLKSSNAFVHLISVEYSRWEAKFHDPLDQAAIRKELQSYGRFTRNLERFVRAAELPETIMKAVDEVVVVCGFKKDLSGEPATVSERMVAAANLVKNAVSIHQELAWLARIGQVVLTKLGAGSAVEAISVVKSAAAKHGADIARVVMRWVTPILEKIAATEGGAMATRVAGRVAVALGEWGVTLSRVTGNTAFRAAANLLGERLGLALRFGLSWPVAIAIEIGKLELEFANHLFGETYKNLSRWLSARLFGKTIDELKQQIRGKPDSNGAACDALFRYAFHSMLPGAVSRVATGWVPYLVQKLPGRTVLLPAQFSTRPEQTLLGLDPPDLKLIAAAAIKDIAYEYLDQEYRREFGEDP